MSDETLIEPTEPTITDEPTESPAGEEPTATEAQDTPVGTEEATQPSEEPGAGDPAIEPQETAIPGESEPSIEPIPTAESAAEPAAEPASEGPAAEEGSKEDDKAPEETPIVPAAGDPELPADQPSAPIAAATSGSVTPPASSGAAADVTVDDKDQAQYQPVQGDTSVNVGAGGKSIKVGDEHVVVGFDGQVFNTASASQAARGVPWEVFIKLEGIALEQAAALAGLVREHHHGHHKSEKEWRQVVAQFYADQEG